MTVETEVVAIDGGWVLVAVDGVWVLVLLGCAAAAAVALALEGSRRANAPMDAGWRPRGGRALVLVSTLLGLALLVLAAWLSFAALAGGALLALAWGVRQAARSGGRLPAGPAGWMQALVVAAVAGSAGALLLGLGGARAESDQGAMAMVGHWLSFPALWSWLAGLVFGVMLIEIAGALLAAIPSQSAAPRDEAPADPAD